MTDNSYTKEEMIALLRSAVLLECEKTEDEINLEYIEACSALLAELTDAKYAFTEEELNKRYAEILRSAAPTGHTAITLKPRRRYRKLFTAAAVAAVIASLTFSVWGYDPYIRNQLYAKNHLEVGESMEIDGVTYQRNGVTQFHSSVQELLEKEQLTILYPEVLPEGVAIKSVFRIDDTVYFQFTEAGFAFTVTLNPQNDLSSEITGNETYIAGELEFDVILRDEEREHYNAFAMYEGNWYTVETKEYSQLTEILDELGRRSCG